MQAIKINNYKNVITMMQGIVLLVIVASIGFSVYIYYTANQELSSLRSQIWVFNPVSGAAYKADLKERSEGIRVSEYRHHVMNFYDFWYEYDQYDFMENADIALNLIGDIGKEMWDKDKTAGNLAVLQEKNMSVKIEVQNLEIYVGKEADDFIKKYNGYFDFASRQSWPIVGYIEAVQTLHTANGSRSRNMHSMFSLKDMDKRTDENPHAAMIMDFFIYDDEIIN